MIRRVAVLLCLLSAAACTGEMGGGDDGPAASPASPSGVGAGSSTIAGMASDPARPPARGNGPSSTATPLSPAEMAIPSQPADVAAPQMPIADECGLKTRFAGDAFCVKPPPPDKGMQIHLGPSDYENPEPQFVLEPGQEVTEPYAGSTPNDREVYFFYRQQRMRPGSHHLLMFYGQDLIVSAQNPISDTPAGGKIAPEDEGVGIALPARAPLNGSIHYINTTDKPILKEAWINFWFKDESEVKEHASSIFARAPIAIPPGQHVVLATDCPIMGSGRIIRLFGHKHANNVRWSTYRVRGDQRDLLFEDYEHWEEPLILEYSSITQNPKPDQATRSPGGWSGVIDVQQGDTLRFECEIINNTSRTFTGQNEALDDEMCIQNGNIVGATLPYTCRSSSTTVD